MKIKYNFDSSDVEKQVIKIFNEAPLERKAEFILARADLKGFVRNSVFEDMLDNIAKEIKNV